jgi:NADP-dependent 3-hydroxy acid dehydrogenase YdfG
MGRFSDKVVVVTGAGSGIGRAIARQVHAEGAKVVAVDIVAAGVEELAEQLDAGRVVPVAPDSREGERVCAAVVVFVAKVGGIVVL